MLPPPFDLGRFLAVVRLLEDHVLISCRHRDAATRFPSGLRRLNQPTAASDRGISKAKGNGGESAWSNCSRFVNMNRK